MEKGESCAWGGKSLIVLESSWWIAGHMMRVVLKTSNGGTSKLDPDPQ
jgi:hypothetical protein